MQRWLKTTLTLWIFLLCNDLIVARKEKNMFFLCFHYTFGNVYIKYRHITLSHCGTLTCMVRWPGCNPVFTLLRNTHYFPLKDLVKVNLLFGKNWNSKHYIKRRSCSLTHSNHCCSSPSYLGVSLGAAVMRPQRNISALWLRTDQ